MIGHASIPQWGSMNGHGHASILKWTSVIRHATKKHDELCTLTIMEESIDGSGYEVYGTDGIHLRHMHIKLIGEHALYVVLGMLEHFSIHL